jgi:hypothetical protein
MRDQKMHVYSHCEDMSNTILGGIKELQCFFSYVICRSTYTTTPKKLTYLVKSSYDDQQLNRWNHRKITGICIYLNIASIYELRSRMTDSTKLDVKVIKNPLENSNMGNMKRGINVSPIQERVLKLSVTDFLTCADLVKVIFVKNGK